MPKYENDYGFGNFTAKKFKDFDKFIEDYLAIVQAVLNKNNTWYKKGFHYIDINAGPGILPNLYNKDNELIIPEGTLGSPFTFLKWAEKYKIPYTFDFIEKNPESAKILIDHANNINLARGKGKVWLHDHNLLIPKLLPKYKKWQFGLIYHDPNNGTISFDTIKYCIKMRPKYEILINFPGSLFKRSPSHYRDDIYISNHIEGLKEVWMIKDLTQGDKHHWTFLLGTDFTSMKDFKSIGLHSINKPRGAKVFELVDKSKKQRKKKLQPMLPIENI